MKPVAISLALGLAAGAATMSFAEDRHPGHQGAGPDRGRSAFTQDDRAAFQEGRIAGLKAALRLTPEQEKNWPAFEQALRDVAKQRAEAREKMRERWASFKADREAGKPFQRNIPEELKNRAERMAASADSLRKLADASAPLYASLDDAQKRRLGVLMHFAGREGMQGHRRGGQRHGWRDEERGERRGGHWRERRGSLEGQNRDFAELGGRHGWERHGFGDRDGLDERFESGRFQ